MRWNSISCLDFRVFVYNYGRFLRVDFKKKFLKKVVCIVVLVVFFR